MLQTVDRSVLLLLKTNDCLRSAAARLGARATETYLVTAETCIRALEASGDGGVSMSSGGGRWAYVQWRWGLYQARARIMVFRVIMWWRGDGG